jgi:hypothetical protein
VNTSVALAAGTHVAQFVAVDNTGAFLKSPGIGFTVGSGGGCSAPTSAGVHVCAPQPGGSYTSPVQMTATGKGPNGTTSRMELWIDGKKINNYFSSTVSTSVALGVGSHSATFVAVDNTGAFVKSAVVNFTVH